MNYSSLKPQDSQTFKQNYLETLHALYQHIYLVLVILTSLAAYVAAIRYFYYFKSSQAGLLVCLVIALVISIPLRKKFLRLATWVLLLGAGFGVAFETIANPLGPAKYSFGLVIVLASLTLSGRALISTGAASAAFLLVMSFRPLSQQEGFLQAALFSAGITLVLFLGIRLVLTSLEQATQYVYMANDAMEEARSSRGKLVQTVKALDEGNYRLEKAYQKLALARDEANQAREMKIHFANMISHELRAPLNFIIGATDLMMWSPKVYGNITWPPELREDIRRLYDSSKHLSNLIDDVLTLGQIEANRVALRFEPSSIVDVINDVLLIIRPSYEHRGLYLVLEAGSDIPRLQLDRVRIRQVMLNLLNNAYRFVKSGGVTIKVQYIGSNVLVTVEDTGIGIPADKIGGLFQDFFQVNDQSETNDSTSGLGLSISQQFIRLHGGNIWVESPIQEGSASPGTRFSFTLPARSEGPLQKNDEMERRYWRIQNEDAHKDRPLIIFTELAVDDLLPNGSFTNYTVTIVSDREQVDAQIFALQPDALIEISAGKDSLLSEKTQGLLEHEKIPYLHCQVEQEDTGVDPLWDEYLIKPFTIEQVTAVVDEVCPGAARYMVVDDDVNMLRLFDLGLSSIRRKQVQVMQATTGQHALALLDQEMPDVLFLDINLPDTNGLDFLKQIKQEGRFKALPVVIISALNKPYLYKTSVRHIVYHPGQGLDREAFIHEMEGFLESIQLNARV